jgi:hypothetical protein
MVHGKRATLPLRLVTIPPSQQAKIALPTGRYLAVFGPSAAPAMRHATLVLKRHTLYMNSFYLDAALAVMQATPAPAGVPPAP